MTTVLTDSQNYTDIASAIRSKAGVQDLFKPSEMAAAILAIPSGGSAVLGSKAITQNGTYYASADNLDGYSSVNVSVGSGGVAFETPIETDVSGGYVASGKWNYSPSEQAAFADVYSAQPGHKYLVMLGANVGNRFRAVFLPTSPIGAQANIQGTQINNDVANPSPNAICNVATAASSMNYIAIGKTNASETGIKTYVLDVTDL